jgi:hypothetical protein
MPDSIRTTTTTIQKLKEKEGEIIPEMIGNDDPLKFFCKIFLYFKNVIELCDEEIQDYIYKTITP